MPNHVTNIVTFEGDEAEVIEMMEAIKGHPSGLPVEGDEASYPCINFNRIIPMPEDLQNSVSPTRQGKEESNEDFEARIKRCLELYGATNWYDWACENWGTKWNAYDQKLEDWNVINFDTAWSTPVPLFMTLAEQYPNILIKVSYADEDLGYNCGKLEFLGTLTGEWHPEFGGDEAHEFAAQTKYNKSYAELEAEWEAEEAEWEAKQKAKEEAESNA